MIKKIVVTGATGHIGKALLQSSQADGFEIHAIVRSVKELPQHMRDNDNIMFHTIDDLAQIDPDQLAAIMADAHMVIHLAALIVEDGPIEDSQTVHMARNVAAACHNADIPNIINLSSIYARFAEENVSHARLYGHRKRSAENNFIVGSPNANIIFLRPPAVYGQGMSGSISLLIKLVSKNVPMPFGRTNAERDYISINNLTDLIWHITSHSDWPKGRNYYEPSDGLSVSTKTLVSEIASVMNKRALLLPVPVTLLKVVGTILGKADMIDGAVGAVQATGNAALLQDFNWAPKEQIPESLDFLHS